MENAINTRLIDVEENQNVLRIDMDAMDYEFAKMTDLFEHMQKKTDDLETKVELLDTQSRLNNLLFFGTPRVFGSDHEGASACADRPSTRSWFRHSCAVPILQAARRRTEPQQRAQSDRVPDIRPRGFFRSSQTETFWLETLAETIS